MVDDGHAGLGGDVLAAGVDQVFVLFTRRRQGAVPDYAVFGVEDDFLGGVGVVGAEGGHTHAQVDDPLVLEFHSQPVAHGLAVKSGFVGHQRPPVVALGRVG